MDSNPYAGYNDDTTRIVLELDGKQMKVAIDRTATGMMASCSIVMYMIMLCRSSTHGKGLRGTYRGGPCLIL